MKRGVIVNELKLDKICCEYCGSYVSAHENETCPNCGGSLKDAILKEKTRVRLAQIAEQERQDKLAKEAKDAQDTEEVFDFIKTLAGSAAGGAIAGALGRAAGEFIKEDFKNAFKKK